MPHAPKGKLKVLVDVQVTQRFYLGFNEIHDGKGNKNPNPQSPEKHASPYSSSQVSTPDTCPYAFSVRVWDHTQGTNVLTVSNDHTCLFSGMRS